MTRPMHAPALPLRLGWALPAWLAGWVLGVAVQLQQAALWAVWGYVAVLGLGAATVVIARGRGAWMRALGWLLCGALLAFALVGLRAGQRPVLDAALEGRDIELTGVVSRMPQRIEVGWRFRLWVEQARLDGTPVVLPPTVQLGWYGRMAWGEEGAATALPALRAGDRWRMTVRLKAPHGNLNPHGFDYELWLWEQGVAATGYVRTSARDAPPERLAQAVGHPVERARQSVRDAILAAAPGWPTLSMPFMAQGQGPPAEPGPARYAGIVAALVTGDQNLIERADWDVFRITGVAHLMAISGLHITMFAWLAVAVLGVGWRWAARVHARLGLPARLNPCLRVSAPVAALVGGVALAAGYALFSGWGVPAQRTVLMLTTFAALKLAGLRWPWWLSWLLACAVVLAFDPWALWQAGFWLSFVAVGVLFATDLGAHGAAQTGAGVGAGGQVRQLLREQWVVTLALTPLSLLLFGQASVVGLVANLLAIPWVTVVVTPLSMLGVLWPPVWQAAAWALVPLAAFLQALAGWPWASVWLATAPLALAAAAVAGGVLLAMPWPRALRLAGAALVLPLVLWQPARPAPGQFELLAADVGQGNAVIVRTARHTLLYDAGPRYSLASDAGERVLLPLLRATGERVDMLLLSHRDTDHTGGAPAVLRAWPRAPLLSSIEEAHALQATRPAMRCQAGQQWQWDGVRFALLHPLAADYAHEKRPNALSCVLRVQAADGGPAALLAGDIEAAQERALLARHAPGELQAQVLLVPHHGSRTSSTADWLDAVAPRWALVQAGYRNRFNHPVPDVVARHAVRGMDVVTSPRCGAMHWRSALPDVVQCEREQARRYWHHRVP
ncbi:MAG: DNA internalization-related competence protein ComEC/Rec2 [Pseudomonadota bacterium]|nr:DNA internalization-related competence protein ComEC/Rec2 [Pseudomonadota bacterium]